MMTINWTIEQLNFFLFVHYLNDIWIGICIWDATVNLLTIIIILAKTWKQHLPGFSFLKDFLATSTWSLLLLLCVTAEDESWFVTVDVEEVDEEDVVDANDDNWLGRECSRSEYRAKDGEVDNEDSTELCIYLQWLEYIWILIDKCIRR